MRNKKLNLFEMMEKVNPNFKYENYEDNIIDKQDKNYREKIDKIKSNIDVLFKDLDYETIDALYKLIVNRSHSNININEIFTKLINNDTDE